VTDARDGLREVLLALALVKGSVKWGSSIIYYYKLIMRIKMIRSHVYNDVIIYISVQISTLHES